MPDSKNAWIIDRDLYAEAEAIESSDAPEASFTPAKPGTNANAVGKCNFQGFKKMPSDLLLGHHFRMLDDGRNVMYEGRAYRPGTFDPLDDFGKPNAGCTIIQYMDGDGVWRDL